MFNLDTLNTNSPVSVGVAQPMSQPPLKMKEITSEKVLLVGGSIVNTIEVTIEDENNKRRHHGQRGVDKIKRSCRKCAFCMKYNGSDPSKCLGRASRSSCQYFNTDGTSKPTIAPTTQ